MPDSSGEPHPPSQPPAAAHPASGEPAHLHPAPRLHPASVHPPREATAPASSPLPAPDLNALLELLRRNGLAGTPPDEPVPAPPAARSHLPKEHRKFHKFDPEHPHPEQPPAGEVDPSRVRELFPSGVVDENLPASPSSPGGIVAARSAYMRRLNQQKPDQIPWLAAGLAVLVFLLVLGAFVLGHFTLPTIHPAVPPQEMAVVQAKVPTALPDGVMEVIDQATAAEMAKDYPRAIGLLEAAQRGAGHVYGLNYRLASLCYKANEMTRVVPLLNLSINQGEEVAACYSLRGVLSNEYERTARGPGDLETATQVDPLNARYFFVWGEALRRAGKPEQALVQLRRAVDRLQEPALLGIYALKLRLTQLALDDDAQFAAELAARLKHAAPPVDWLLTAAALEMHRGHFRLAAELLARVRAASGEQETARQLQDVFFTPFAREKELAEFFEDQGSPGSSTEGARP